MLSENMEIYVLQNEWTNFKSNILILFSYTDIILIIIMVHLAEVIIKSSLRDNRSIELLEQN